MITKKDLFDKVDKIGNEIIENGTKIFENPELGFKEYKTAELIKRVLIENGLEFESELSITGIRCKFGSGNGPNVGVLAEMDAIPTLGHRCASDDLSAAHSCGHSLQVAIMLGVVSVLKESRFFDNFNGYITFIGAPAEEFTDIDYRKTLVENGKVKYMSGKQDMIYNGIFDDIDLILSCHIMGEKSERSADVNTSLNGFIHKEVCYIGKAAHAGAEPHLGINALNAAVIGLGAVNAQRETFIDEHNIRVHSVMKNGTYSVNTVPDKVEIEAYVRGGNIKSLLSANERVNRAFRAGGYAVGAEVIITDTNGYIPFKQCAKLSSVVKDNLKLFLKSENIFDGLKTTASGDIGDLSVIVPTIQFGFSGVKGSIHGPDLEVSDKEMAYIIPTKVILGTIYDLFSDDSKKAKEIVDFFVPEMDREEYFKQWLNM